MPIKLLFDYVYLYNTKNNKDPKERYLYFYDLSDDTVFRTNDEESLERFMYRTPRAILSTVLLSKDKKLRIHSLLILLPFIIGILLARLGCSNALVTFGFYIPSILVTINFYVQIVRIKTEEMIQLKQNGKTVKVSGEKEVDPNKEITSNNVRLMIDEGMKQEKIGAQLFFVNVTALLGLLVPIAFMHVFDTSLEILPHNYLRLRSHLKRIENELI